MPTQVTFGAYKGFGTDFTPIRPPNPRCCSDVHVLCPQCAALALKQAGVTTCNEAEPTVNAHQSGLTPTPPPDERIAPPKRSEPCRPCDDAEGRTEPGPVKYSPSGIPLTYVPCPGDS
mgnify:CR=1 FL=1